MTKILDDNIGINMQDLRFGDGSSINKVDKSEFNHNQSKI